MPVGLRNRRAALLEQGFKEKVNDFSTVNVELGASAPKFGASWDIDDT